MLKKHLPLLGLASAAFLAGCGVQSRAQVPLTESGPLLRLTDAQMSPDPFLITYGDIRFTNPGETTASSPKVRRWLADRIAAEKPDAVLISGDVPWHGGEKSDYAVFRAETEAWRAANLFIAPALGNHEVNGLNQQQCLENWWETFPRLRGHRWYAAQLGSRIYAINLDSTSDLTAGSDQQVWLGNQLRQLPPTVRFVFFNLHHPPAADNQPGGDADHNERPNELALAAFLTSAQASSRAQLIVVAGHIHNYERFERSGIVYLVSGGGGAQPRKIQRHPGDLFTDAPEVNYHFVRFHLKNDAMEAEMVRAADPAAGQPAWEVRDRFRVAGRRQ